MYVCVYVCVSLCVCEAQTREEGMAGTAGVIINDSLYTCMYDSFACAHTWTDDHTCIYIHIKHTYPYDTYCILTHIHTYIHTYIQIADIDG